MGEEAVLRRVKESVEEVVGVESIYLFGSRARGDYSKGSDFDIAVVSEEFEGMERQERYEAVVGSVREAVGDRPVDIICYTPEEFEEGSESFLPSLILEEGISV